MRCGRSPPSRVMPCSRALRCAVPIVRGLPVQARCGSSICAVTRRRSRGGSRTGSIATCAVQVDLDNLLPVLLGLVEQRLRDRNAGIVDDDGDGTECRGCLVERRVDACRIRYVERDGLDVDAVTRQRILHRAQRLDTPRGDCDIGARRREGLGEMAAQAAVGAGDQCIAPSQFEFHRSRPLSNEGAATCAAPSDWRSRPSRPPCGRVHCRPRVRARRSVRRVSPRR